MFRQIHIYYILAFICFLIHFEPVWAQNVPLSTEYTRIYDFFDELSTDGVIRINHAVRPYTRKAIAEWLLEAQKSDSLLSKRQKSDLQFYLNEFALERDTVKNNFVQYTDHQTFNLSLADPQFSYISKNKQFKLSLRPILGMEIIGGKKGVILKRWWGAELTMDIAKHLSIWGSLRDISWNGTFGLSDAYYSDVYAKIDGAKLTKPGYLNNMLGVQYKEANYGGDFSDSRGGINAYTWWGSIGLQRENIKWGDAYHCSNILSGRNPAVPMVTLQLTPCKWFQFDYFHAWLVSNIASKTYYYEQQAVNKADSIITNLQYRPHNKFMAANMFTFMPIKYVQFSFGNSIVYAENNVQAAYFIPFAFYKSLDHLLTKGLGTENQNSQFFFSLSLHPVDHLKLYTSCYVDEVKFSRFKKSNPQNNPISYLVGFDWTGWPIKGLSLKGEFMRSYIACYSHSIPVLDFTSNSYNMGHYMGDNAQSIFVELSYRPIRGMHVGLSYVHDTKYNSYDYIRGDVANAIAQKPFDKAIFCNEALTLDLTYEVHPNMYLTANVMYNNARAYDNLTSTCVSEITGTAAAYLNKYAPVFYQGKNITASAGFSFSF